MSAIEQTPAETVARVGATEEEARRVLDDPETLRAVMRDRNLSEDVAVFVLIANAQARRHRDVIITLPE